MPPPFEPVPLYQTEFSGNLKFALVCEIWALCFLAKLHNNIFLNSLEIFG